MPRERSQPGAFEAVDPSNGSMCKPSAAGAFEVVTHVTSSTKSGKPTPETENVRPGYYSTYSYLRSFIRPQPTWTNSPSGVVNSSTSASLSWLCASWTVSYSS